VPIGMQSATTLSITTFDTQELKYFSFIVGLNKQNIFVLSNQAANFNANKLKKVSDCYFKQ